MTTKYEIDSSRGKLLFHLDQETGRLVIESGDDKTEIEYTEAEKVVSKINRDMNDYEIAEKERRSQQKIRKWFRWK